MTEGTYPFVGGGVSTWCDVVLSGLPEVDFHVVAVTGSPALKLYKPLPDNVASLHAVPLWGMAEPTEHSRFSEPFAKTVMHRARTSERNVEEQFLPLFRRLLALLRAPETAGPEAAKLVLALHVFFRRYDYRQTFRSEAVWTCFRDACVAEAEANGEPAPLLGHLVMSLRWLYSFLLPLTVPVPRVDVSHATLAGFAALPGVVAKAEYGVPLMVTDHGIYLRERYIANASPDEPVFTSRFLLRLTHLVSRVVYAVADQVSPVCDHNQRWEKRMGVDDEALRTIYNGIDTDAFVAPDPPPVRDRPTVVTAARVFPLKDIETMIRGCAVARERVPDIKLIVYGNNKVDLPYTERCEALIDELGLRDHFVFAGYHDNPKELYHDGDVFVLSSISEGFPFSVIEAMACGRPVVATDVGGVREAVADCGIVVPPRDHQGLGEGLATLLLDEELRAELAAKGRARVVEHFGLDGMIDAHRTAYARLASTATVGLADGLSDQMWYARDVLDVDLKTLPSRVERRPRPGGGGGDGAPEVGWISRNRHARRSFGRRKRALVRVRDGDGSVLEPVVAPAAPASAPAARPAPASVETEAIPFVVRRRLTPDEASRARETRAPRPRFAIDVSALEPDAAQAPTPAPEAAELPVVVDRMRVLERLPTHPSALFAIDEEALASEYAEETEAPTGSNETGAERSGPWWKKLARGARRVRERMRRRE